ncbi:hypothetical protein [Streptacidiphilus sp. MAP5-52]|uniref:hypothetical protein n=1 Tax=Streptacidiphilus sp. MAP5-52 TaxID=3156267 RepID=UPI003513C34F
MATAHQLAAVALGATASGAAAWGWQGRTLGRQVTTAEGQPAWLRLLSAPVERASGKLWEGTTSASQTLPETVRRPRLLAVHDWTAGPLAYRAELTSYLTDPVCSPDPILQTPVDLPDTWWIELRTGLATIASTPTDRIAVRQVWIDRSVPEFTGMNPPRIEYWTAAHGDMHWANLIGPRFAVLDFEGWGLAPAGYDAAVLHTYSLLVPDIAERVRSELGNLISSAQGRAAELVVLTEILQTISRGDNLELQVPVQSRLAALSER